MKSSVFYYSKQPLNFLRPPFSHSEVTTNPPEINPTYYSSNRKPDSSCRKINSKTQMYAIKGRSSQLLLVSRFVRLFAYASSTLILADFLSVLGFSDTLIGTFMSLTLFGDVFISVLLTLFADVLGRRRMLSLGAILMAFSGVVFALSSNYTILLLAAIVGVISPAGNEIGPFRAIEESTLAHLTDEDTRAEVFAVYVIVGAIASSLGNLVSGFVLNILQTKYTKLDSYRYVFWTYAAFALVKLVASLCLAADCEVTREEDETSEVTPLVKPRTRYLPKISRESWKILAVLGSLFAIDSLGSGLMPGSLMVYFFTKKFSLAASTLGTIFSVTILTGAFSNLFSTRLAKRIGLVKTMAFTHLPSAIFLLSIPFASSLWLSVTFLILRTVLASMDQAPKSAFISLLVSKNERTAIMGMINVIKTLSQSFGPVATGVLSSKNKFWLSFVLAGSLKATYDVLLLVVFDIKTRWMKKDSQNVDA